MLSLFFVFLQIYRQLRFPQIFIKRLFLLQ